MTDNTPRPSEHSEPMTREQVLAVLDEAHEYLCDDPIADNSVLKRVHQARAAVAALYERCEALERALDGPDRSKPPCLECGATTEQEAETMCKCSGDKDDCHGVELWGGTEPSDAEGGG